MVTAKDVVWTEAAKEDLLEVYHRIAAKSVEKAKQTIESIVQKTATLHQSYALGMPEPMLKNEKDPYKYLIIGFYKVIYSIVEEKIMIETLYHTRQDPIV